MSEFKWEVVYRQGRAVVVESYRTKRAANQAARHNSGRVVKAGQAEALVEAMRMRRDAEAAE